MVKIEEGTERENEVVRSLLSAYTKELGRDLSFQHLTEELRDPVKKYTMPHGELLLARQQQAFCGMVAYRRLDAQRCEMKRLYVKSEWRGSGNGEALAKAIIARARTAGYQEMLLDTLEQLRPAIRLYEKLGFVRCSPYYDNPLPDVVYMHLWLRPKG